MTHPDPAYLTTQDIAADIGVVTKTVLNWVKTGELPGQKFGRQYFVERATYRRWKKQREIKPCRFTSGEGFGGSDLNLTANPSEDHLNQQIDAMLKSLNKS